MKVLSLILCIAAVQVAMAAETPKGGEEAILNKAVDQCMAKLSNGKAAAGFSDLLGGYWYDKSEVASVNESVLAQYQSLLSMAKKKLGEPLPDGYEFLGTRRVGKSSLRFVYIQKFDNGFLPWVFMFFRPKEKWLLTGIFLGDSAADDLRTFTLAIPAQ